MEIESSGGSSASEPVKKGRRFRIVFDKKNCIGAAACAAVAPEFWVMKDDGKADLVGHRVDEDGNQVLVVSETELTPEGKRVLDLNKEAAEVCPVQVIHIYDDETGEKII
ncbi:hypothetical protein C4580_03305 [Candidatus Woesearchaeota archaeon]|nr:MAG: hypothetical protein C4580_03305 [Candidatus Woesearchaeota archaeon]